MASLEEWPVDVTYIQTWLKSLPTHVYYRVDGVVALLALHGPALGGPWVDRIQGSRIHNLKELRTVTNSRHQLRVLFVFTEARTALMLAAGDKRGDWGRWYDKAIAEAERNYDRYLNP